MRALEFIRDHVTFKLPYDFSYQMKTPLDLTIIFQYALNLNCNSTNFQKIRQINVCQICTRLDQLTKTSSMFDVLFLFYTLIFP